jgi:2-isopropylmalate synthase
VEVGVVQVQGTINGYGERAGNADLTSVIPNLKLKLGIDCVTHEQLQSLTDVSRFVREIANQLPRPHQPYVGHSAFSHKGGVHISGVARNPRTYEHIEPELVGNHRHILASELSGRSAVISKASEYNIDLTKYPEKTKEILDRLKDLEAQGYEFEAADASFELMIKRSLGLQKPYFRLKSFRVIVERGESGSLISEATVKLEVGSRKEYTVAEGDGPINALDTALREALGKFYPVLKKMHLTDYKVRVLDAKKGTAAKVRVLIESSDNRSTWGTVGVSENIIEASWEALVDSIDYTLSKYL